LSERFDLSRFRIGLIGGSGYIGSALANYLSEAFMVKVLDKSPLPRDLEGKVKYQNCDILNYKEAEQALAGLDLVIHTAVVQIPLITHRRKLGYEVNVLGTQNVSEAVNNVSSTRGMILASSWHVFGERELDGVLDEEFGFRPDKVEERARLYALSKIAQEVVVRYYDEMSEKIYGLIRMATVLGNGMPEKTAAKIFISRGLRGESITPFKHSMYRPMLYVDISDVCRAFRIYATKILSGEIRKEENSLAHIVNLCWPKPVTIIELAHTVRDAITKLTEGKIEPQIEIVDKRQPILFEAADKQKLRVNIGKVQRLLGMKRLKDPRSSIERIVKKALQEDISHVCYQ